MSFADIETGQARPNRTYSSSGNSEESAFQTLQSSLSLQVFKINANVQGILKLVDQLGTGRDSAALRKGLYAIFNSRERNVGDVDVPLADTT